MNFFPVWCVLSSCDGLCIMHFDNSAKYSLHCNSIRVDCSRQGPPKIEPNLKIKTRQSYSIHLFWHFFCVFLFFLSFPLSIFLISSYQPSVSPFHKIFIQMFLDWWSFEIERIGEEKRKSAGRVHFDCGAMTNYLQQAGRKQHREWGRGKRDRIPHLDHIASIAWREIWIFLQTYFSRSVKICKFGRKHSKNEANEKHGHASFRRRKDRQDFDTFWHSCLEVWTRWNGFYKLDRPPINFEDRYFPFHDKHPAIFNSKKKWFFFENSKMAYPDC